MTAHSPCPNRRCSLYLWLALVWALSIFSLPGQDSGSAQETVVLLSVEGKVEVLPAGAAEWRAAEPNQVLPTGTQIRTDKNSRALLRSSRLGQLRVRESSVLVIQPPNEPEGKPVMGLIKGFFYFFNRDKEIEVELHNRLASATTRGTEFLVTAGGDGEMSVSVLEGGVVLRNASGAVELGVGDQGLAQVGQLPKRVARIDALNVLQWCLFYPAILDVDELALSSEERAALKESLAAYRAGDILGALQAYPAGRLPASDAERIYAAALQLSVGEAEQTLELLRHVSNDSPLAAALRELVAAVRFQTVDPLPVPASASAWMARSYYEQSRASLQPGRLEDALKAARNAVAKSPEFGFAWARVAELEFSFGRTAPASAALERALQLSPRNASAMALKGFVLSAQNRLDRAIGCFEQAIALDGGMANSWLGRGLCRIKQGQAEAGRADLLAAAALEPQRALLRSYLGKAFADTQNNKRAATELQLARQLDPNDPTSWLYSALFLQRQNRINEAIDDLEQSQKLNENRSLFRSRLLLDEDRATRSANLAGIYRDAGMAEVSLWEAARSVTTDYASDVAHLRLSDSYNELRDPTRFNLRYETVWFNEYLLANLLAPVGGGRLAQHVSQQEYSRLFDANGLGVVNSTEARSDGQVRELVSQFGTFGPTSYSLDLDYQHNDGVRPNNDLNRAEWYTTIKQQVTPQDTALFLMKYQDYHSGDNFQYYDPSVARPNYRFDEYQHPILLGGWHHEWSPGMHTLVLGGHLANEQLVTDKAAPQLLLIQNPAGNIYASDFEPFDVDYHNQLGVYTAEVNQLFQWDRLSLSVGGRAQTGTIEAHSLFSNPPAGLAPLFSNPVADDSATSDLQRFTGYSYLTLEPVERLRLLGGLAYDDLTFPRNYRNPPVSSGEAHVSQVGPKAGLVWDFLPEATLRGAYTRSLGGVSLDESYRLEQSQVAGFPQTFRTLMSESVVGSVAAPDYHTYSLALDLRFPSRTYAELQVERLESTVDGSIGVLSLQNGLVPFASDSTLEELNYRENALNLSVDQLLGDYFVVGTGYRLAQAKLHDELPSVPVAALPSADRNLEALLHQVLVFVQFNHPSGFFSRVETQWYAQSNRGYTPELPGDDFFQCNLFAGYRFWNRHLELLFGILNVGNQDYRLNPLTIYEELPRERTYVGRLNFQF